MEIAERISGEVPELERMIKRAQTAWDKASMVSTEQDFYLDSVALNLHGIYSGIEKLFELIAVHLDDNPPKGKTWHRDLLRKMTQEVPGKRPAVIACDRLPRLDALRRFRHLVRNVYTFNLALEKVAPIIAGLSELWVPLKDELLAFAEYTDDMGGDGGDGGDGGRP
ncbi:putative toxin-antitoxin system, antitoxin component [delta proteobacterium NaphS2]|nr:putative toxin-antitoxin system, antitoxin component [delta proteobacterium NaphS2]